MESKSYKPVFGDTILKYWQFIIALLAIVVGWTMFEARLSTANIEITDLKGKITQLERDQREYQQESLQRLSSIEAKVDFLVRDSGTNSSVIENKVNVQAAKPALVYLERETDYLATLKKEDVEGLFQWYIATR